jgi:hypothetical protein
VQVSQEQLDKILGLVEMGKKEGATLETGGARWGDRGYVQQRQPCNMHVVCGTTVWVIAGGQRQQCGVQCCTAVCYLGRGGGLAASFPPKDKKTRNSITSMGTDLCGLWSVVLYSRLLSAGGVHRLNIVVH